MLARFSIFESHFLELKDLCEVKQLTLLWFGRTVKEVQEPWLWNNLQVAELRRMRRKL